MTTDPVPAPARNYHLLWLFLLGPLVGLYVGKLATHATKSPAQDAMTSVVIEIRKIKTTTGSLPKDLTMLPADLQHDIKEFNLRISADGRELESTTSYYYGLSLTNLLTLGLIGEKSKYRNPGFLLDRL